MRRRLSEVPGLIGVCDWVKETFAQAQYSIRYPGGEEKVYGFPYRSLNHLLKDHHEYWANDDWLREDV